MEKIDKDSKSISSKEYMKSKLMLFPTIDNIKQGVYIGILVLLLFILSSHTNSTLDLVFYWVLAGLAVEIPITLYMTIITRNAFRIKIDKLSFFKYVLSAILVFGIMSFILDEYLQYKNSIFEFLPLLLFYGIISMVAYVGLTYIIDKRTRILVKAIWNEIVKIKNKN